MKKVLFLLPLLALGLVGCKNQPCTCSTQGGVSNGPLQTVSLSKNNFSTYVATNTTMSFDTNHVGYAHYHTNFIGAGYCKFINCSVTYAYIMNGSTSTSGNEVPLTLSGDGETKECICRINNAGVSYDIYIVSAKGTVEVYR